jgi:CubicO group peptidase (beta-lactamase class C family)
MPSVFSGEIEPRIRNTLNTAVDRRVFPGAVAGVVSRAGARCVIPVGALNYDIGSPAVTESTLYDTASITKVIPTSILALIAVEQGLIQLDTRLTSLVPEFTNSSRDLVTVRHLLTQTIDFGYALSSCKGLSPIDLLQVLLTRDFRSPPGQCFGFTNGTSILLGMLVERAFGKPLDRLAREMLFNPLRMERTSFPPFNQLQNDIAPTEIDDWRGGTVQGSIHDESAYVLRKIMVPGSAGLFSTVPELLNFLQMLLCDGDFNGKSVISSETIRTMHVNQIPELGKWAGLGWELNQIRFMGLHSSVHTIGKTGFTGGMVLCDFEAGLALAVLSNCTFPGRKPNADQIHAVRREIADDVFMKAG